MKRVLMITAIVLAFLCSVSVFAQTYNDEEIGIAYTLSDAWQKNQKSDKIEFLYNGEKAETLSIEYMENGWINNVDQIDVEEIKNKCSVILFEDMMMENLFAFDSVSISIKSEETDYETVNGIKFYKIHNVVETADGKEKVVETYVTAKNGRVFFFKHQGEGNVVATAEIKEMLASLTFDGWAENVEIDATEEERFYADIKADKADSAGETAIDERIIRIFIDGERIFPDAAPIIRDDRTLVPIRAVAENMGYTVSWEEKGMFVDIVSAQTGTNLRFKIGSNIVFKDSMPTVTDVTPILYNDKTYLPLRAVAELMGATVEWNEAERTVEISR